MEEIKINYNRPFPSLNEYINVERTCKFKAAKMKKENTNICAYLTLKSKSKLDEKKVYDFRFVWYKPNNKKDHDNIAFAKKFILDGMVVSGFLKNDSPRHVGNFKDEFVIDKTRNYVCCDVFITEKQ